MYPWTINFYLKRPRNIINGYSRDIWKTVWIFVAEKLEIIRDFNELPTEMDAFHYALYIRFYSHFAHKFGQINHPLYNVGKMIKGIVWGNLYQQESCSLRKHLFSDLIHSWKKNQVMLEIRNIALRFFKQTIEVENHAISSSPNMGHEDLKEK